MNDLKGLPMTRSSSTSPALVKLALAGALGLAAASSALAQAQRPAQPAKPAQPAAPAAAPAGGPMVVSLKVDPSVEWTKVCGEDQGAKKTVCYTTRDFLETNSNQPILAAAIYDVQNDPKKFIRMLMPLTFMLQNGIRISVDNGQAIPGKFQICFPNGCFAEAEVNQGVIDQLKKGKELTIMAINQVGAEVSFKMPLDGFAKGFDGKPIDPKELEEQRKKLEEELKKKADEMRQQQGMGAAAPAPATPAPAAPAPAAPAAPATPPKQ
jgi:invasion protein IalB